jgi:hypothetical protein
MALTAADRIGFLGRLVAAILVAVSAPARAPRAAAPGERMQCPKCRLQETERGSAIGWCCTVCGWRELKR